MKKSHSKPPPKAPAVHALPRARKAYRKPVLKRLGVLKAVALSPTWGNPE